MTTVSEWGHTLEPLVTWLEGQGVRLRQPVRMGVLNGGKSNLTYELIASDDQRIVLRRPPAGALPTTAHDISREWRFLAALSTSRVPVPHPLAYCPDVHLLGAPFFVMEFVEGVVVADVATARSISPTARYRAGVGMIDTLVELHSTDPRAIGLADIGPSDNYIARQLHRGHQRWQRSPACEVAGIEDLYHHLTGFAPAQRQSTIVHGDFRLGNIIVDSSGQVRAVLDWELATLGDPLADLGWTVMWWDSPTDAKDAVAASLLDGFPTAGALIDRYAAQREADLSDLPYYVAFNIWRTLCIWAGSLTRQHVSGLDDDSPQFRIGRWQSPSQMVEEALTLIASR